MTATGSKVANSLLRGDIAPTDTHLVVSYTSM